MCSAESQNTTGSTVSELFQEGSAPQEIITHGEAGKRPAAVPDPPSGEGGGFDAWRLSFIRTSPLNQPRNSGSRGGKWLTWNVEMVKGKKGVFSWFKVRSCLRNFGSSWRNSKQTISIKARGFVHIHSGPKKRIQPIFLFCLEFKPKMLGQVEFISEGDTF